MANEQMARLHYGWPFVSIAVQPLWLRALRRMARANRGGYSRYDRDLLHYETVKASR
jgi:hypothetical protein